MFWSGNFTSARELNALLKDENVTLTQVLEADDVLQECKAENKTLAAFLTRPDILSELVSLVITEPPSDGQKVANYRLASLACEVLSSQLSPLSERVSQEQGLLSRIADFLEQPPPLNPLLASYFARTIEMLLDRNPKQDWYLYHIVCLRVLDFFRARPRFLTSLLRHAATSAVADVFHYFIRLDDNFHKVVMEWFEEHQLLDNLMSIVCGTYEPALTEQSEDLPEDGDKNDEEKEPDRALASRAGVASDNVTALLIELVHDACGGDGGARGWSTAAALRSRVCSGAWCGDLVRGACGAGSGRYMANCVALLLAVLDRDCPNGNAAEGAPSPSSEVQRALAPYLPLLHQHLLKPPQPAQEGVVGAGRVAVSRLAARLAESSLHDVVATMLALGTPGVLIDMFFSFPDNNFVQSQLVTLVRNALANTPYRHHYLLHFILECDLLTRLISLHEDNEKRKESGTPRSGNAGHATLIALHLNNVITGTDDADEAPLQACGQPLAVSQAVAAAWLAYCDDVLAPARELLTAKLGGDCMDEGEVCGELVGDDGKPVPMYQIDEDMNEDMDLESYDTVKKIAALADTFNDNSKAISDYFSVCSMWDDGAAGDDDDSAGVGDPTLASPLGDAAPWENSNDTADTSGEGWAQFNADTFGAPVDPFADQEWGGLPTNNDASGRAQWDQQLDRLSLEVRPEDEKPTSEDDSSVKLANNLLLAMSTMTPADLASINITCDDIKNSDDEVPPVDSFKTPEILLADSLAEMSLSDALNQNVVTLDGPANDLEQQAEPTLVEQQVKPLTDKNVTLTDQNMSPLTNQVTLSDQHDTSSEQNATPASSDKPVVIPTSESTSSSSENNPIKAESLTPLTVPVINFSPPSPTPCEDSKLDSSER